MIVLDKSNLIRLKSYSKWKVYSYNPAPDLIWTEIIMNYFESLMKIDLSKTKIVEGSI
jgi:hypothetical protein